MKLWFGWTNCWFPWWKRVLAEERGLSWWNCELAEQIAIPVINPGFWLKTVVYRDETVIWLNKSQFPWLNLVLAEERSPPWLFRDLAEQMAGSRD